MARPFAPLRPSAPTRRVLVVDGDPVLRGLTCGLLEHLVPLVEESADAGAAVARVAEGGIDLVLVDATMPYVDGVEATRRIRRLGGAAGRLPVWVVTSHDCSRLHGRALAAGATGCLSRPVTLDVLAGALRPAPAAATAPQEAAC